MYFPNIACNAAEIWRKFFVYNLNVASRLLSKSLLVIKCTWRQLFLHPVVIILIHWLLHLLAIRIRRIRWLSSIRLLHRHSIRLLHRHSIRLLHRHSIRLLHWHSVRLLHWHIRRLHSHRTTEILSIHWLHLAKLSLIMSLSISQLRILIGSRRIRLNYIIT